MCHTYLTTKFSENQVNSIAFAIILRTNKKQTNKHWWKHNLLGRGNKQWSYLNEWDYNDQTLRCFLKVQQCQGKLSICCTDEAYLMSKRTETGSWSRTGSSGPRLGLRLWPLIGHVWVPSDDCWSLSLISTTTLSANKQISAATSIFHWAVLPWLPQYCLCWSSHGHKGILCTSTFTAQLFLDWPRPLSHQATQIGPCYVKPVSVTSTQHSVNHTNDSCPLMKLKYGLHSLHKEENDTIQWLEKIVTTPFVKWNQIKHWHHQPCSMPSVWLCSNALEMSMFPLLIQRISTSDNC